jgi:uncharacterized RDD family membrane protein YckC
MTLARQAGLGEQFATGGTVNQGEAMADDLQQFGQPPAGAPASWSPQGQAPQPWGPPPQGPAGYPPTGYPPAGYPPQLQAPGAGIAPPTLQTAFEYGGFWIRGAANSIDLSALYLLTILLAITVVGLIVVPFLWLGYFPFFWSRGQTPGQRICGLRLLRERDGLPIDAGAAILRFVVVIGELILCIFLIGFLAFLWPAFESRKRALHDIAAGTVLVHAQLYSR